MRPARSISLYTAAATLVLAGCATTDTVTLADRNEQHRPSSSVSMAMPGAEGEVELRDDALNVFKNVDPSQSIFITASGEDEQSGVRRVSARADFTFDCRIMPSGDETESLSLTREAIDAQRAVEFMTSGDVVPQSRSTVVSFQFSDINRECERNGYGQARGLAVGIIHVSAINYYDQSTAQTYEVQFSFSSEKDE